MLSLNLNQGEYVTIGEDVVVQLDRITGDRCKLLIQAPREISVLRGKVRERAGEQRPGCVFDAPRWHRREIVMDRSKAQALAAMLAAVPNGWQGQRCAGPAAAAKPYIPG